LIQPLHPGPWSRQTRTHTHTSLALFSHTHKQGKLHISPALVPSISTYLLVIHRHRPPTPTTDTADTMPLFRRRQRNQVYQQQRPIQNRNYCCEGHMIIGFILSLVAALLLYVHLPASASLLDSDNNNGLIQSSTLVSLSTPIIKQITFLNTPTERYGAFGYCSTSASSTPGLPGLGGAEGCVRSTGYSTGPEITEWMTRTAALFPLGQSLSLLSSSSILSSRFSISTPSACERNFELTCSRCPDVHHLDNGNLGNV